MSDGARQPLVAYGHEAAKYSWQDPFPTKDLCLTCHISDAVLVMVVQEGMGQADYVCRHRPEGVTGWPHDCMAIGLYLCPFCRGITAHWNQA